MHDAFLSDNPNVAANAQGTTPDDAPSRSTTVALLLIIVCVGMVLRVNEALKTSSLAHPDEIFQTLEPAHRLAYGYGVVTWEWRDGIRSWVFPAVLAGLMRSTDWMGQGSGGYLIAIRILLSVFSMTTVWFGFVWAKHVSGIPVAIISAAGCATWYEIVGFAPRAMTEVLSAHILLIGLFIGVCSERGSEKKRLFLAALLCGITMSLRIQLAPAALFAALYFCRKSFSTKLPMAVGGLMLPVFVFGLVDALTWHHPFQSFYLYFWENVVEGKSLLYGSRPWYWYLAEQAEHLGPMGFLALVGIRRSPLLGTILLVILASHSILAHKEARFLYPILPIVIVLSAFGFGEIMRDVASMLKLTIGPTAFVTIGIFCFAVFSAIQASQFPYWIKDSGAMSAFSALSKNTALCGIGVYGVPWFVTGGYTYLHRNVPVILLEDAKTFAEESSHFNATVTIGAPPVSGNEFVRTDCWNGVCLYTRARSCSKPDANEINAVLKKSGN